jgi:hypothetical protein
MYRRLSLFLSLALVVGAITVSILRADAFGVPTSNLLIEGELRLPDGTSARFQSREGTMVTVRDIQSGAWYGFSPTLQTESRLPNFATYTITTLPDGREEVREIDTGIDIRPGGSHLFSALPLRGGAVEIQVQKVKRGQFSRVVLTDPKSKTPQELQKLFGTVGGGLCALTCNGVTVGANSVNMACGSCNPGLENSPQAKSK